MQAVSWPDRSRRPCRRRTARIEHNRRVVTHREIDLCDHPATPHRVSGAVQPVIWELFASPVLTFLGETARSWTLAGQTASSRPSAGRPARPQKVMLSCSPTRRWWSAMCRASGSARRRPGSGAAAGQRRYDECPFAPGWRACSSCAWPARPAGDNPTAAATTLAARAGLYIDGRRGNQPASSHGRRYAQPDREQPGLTRRYPR